MECQEVSLKISWQTTLYHTAHTNTSLKVSYFYILYLFHAPTFFQTKIKDTHKFWWHLISEIAKINCRWNFLVLDYKMRMDACLLQTEVANKTSPAYVQPCLQICLTLPTIHIIYMYTLIAFIQPEVYKHCHVSSTLPTNSLDNHL